jgi:hypothetical protein
MWHARLSAVVVSVVIGSAAAAAQQPPPGGDQASSRDITLLAPDINGRWHTEEVRRLEIQELSPSERLEEETIRRSDPNGTLIVNERTTTRRLQANGRDESVVEIYARDAEGFVRSGGRPALSHRVRVLTTATADGGRETVEEVEWRNPVAPSEGMQVIRRTVETVRNVGFDRWVTDRQTFERDTNGRLVLVLTDREQSTPR